MKCFSYEMSLGFNVSFNAIHNVNVRELTRKSYGTRNLILVRRLLDAREDQSPTLFLRKKEKKKKKSHVVVVATI